MSEATFKKAYKISRELFIKTKGYLNGVDGFSNRLHWDLQIHGIDLNLPTEHVFDFFQKLNTSEEKFIKTFAQP
jgi:hypothetical protein